MGFIGVDLKVLGLKIKFLWQFPPIYLILPWNLLIPREDYLTKVMKHCFFAPWLFQRISADTLSRYHVKGHMDGYDQPALCYPRYRGPATRSRIPTGLKLIRRVGEKLEKENYPEADEFGWVNVNIVY